MVNHSAKADCITGLQRLLADAASSLEYGVTFRRERKERGSRSDRKQEGCTRATQPYSSILRNTAGEYQSIWQQLLLCAHEKLPLNVPQRQLREEIVAYCVEINTRAKNRNPYLPVEGDRFEIGSRSP